MSNSVIKIEEIISEIENYVHSCKSRMFSSSEIVVSRDEIEGLLIELRKRTPEEIKEYQKIIARKEAILADASARAEDVLLDAKHKAQALLEQATQEHNQMISEHEIFLRAQARADEQVNMAMNQAQGIIDRATMEANALKDAANHYMEDVLNHLAKIIASASLAANANYTKTMQSTEDSFRKLMTSLGEYDNIIQNNIRQLHPEENAPEQAQEYVQEETEESEEN